jgi:hypothetical protein
MKLTKFIANTIKEYLNEDVDNLSKYEKYQNLKLNKPIIVY